MRRSQRLTPKPLVPVLGVPLLERSLYPLFSTGVEAITVAVPLAAPEIEAFVRKRLLPLAGSQGVSLTVLVEEKPLGTLGAASLIGGETLLVVNADNLTALNLKALLADHESSQAAMTLAVHDQPLRLDYGRVQLENDRVLAYEEKPLLHTTIASAVTVLSSRARARMAAGEPCSLPELVGRLLGRGEVVHAHRHDAPWVDVNDADALERATAMVRKHPNLFETWGNWTPPQAKHLPSQELPPREQAPREVVGAVLRRADGALLLEQRPLNATLGAGVWDTPGGKIETSEKPEQALLRELEEELGLADGLLPKSIGIFDEIDLGSQSVVRHHVFSASVDSDSVRSREGQTLRWIHAEELASLDKVNPVVRRSIRLAENPHCTSSEEDLHASL